MAAERGSSGDLLPPASAQVVDGNLHSYPAAMGQPARSDRYVTPEAYLAAEGTRSQKHEYLAGVEYAMAGTNLGHNRIVRNLVVELTRQLDGSPCEAMASDIKVRIRTNTAEFYYYPDVTVDCSNGANSALFAEQPRVIFEVLSPETERIDRGEKLRNYQSLPSLDAYVLVDQHRLGVIVYRREDGGWTREALTAAADVLSLSTLGCALPLPAIYLRTGLDATN
jgi:Uma2 family endonuclease